MSPPSTIRDAVDPGGDTRISWELLAQLDGAPTSREHWKVLLTSGMGFFTDAYDLFVIGVVASILVTQWHITSSQKSLLSSLACSPPRPGRSSSNASLTGSGAGRSTAMRCWYWRQDELVTPAVKDR